MHLFFLSSRKVIWSSTLWCIFYDMFFFLHQHQARENSTDKLETKNSFPKVLIFLCVVSCHVFKPAWQTGTFQVQPVHWQDGSIMEGEEGFSPSGKLFDLFLSYLHNVMLCTSPVSHWLALIEGRTAWSIQLRMEVNICIFCNNLLSVIAAHWLVESRGS